MGIRVDKVFLSCDESLVTYLIRDSFEDVHLRWSDLPFYVDDETKLAFLEEYCGKKLEDLFKSDSMIMIDDKEIAEKLADAL